MIKAKRIIGSIVFLCLVAGLILGLRHIYTVNDFRIEQTLTAFYDEEENSLDAIYIGSSTVYASWQPTTAWRETGMTVFPLSIPNMPSYALRYMIEEGRKTQPDALYIVNLNAFGHMKVTAAHIHYLTDFMPFSMTKVHMVDRLSDEAEFEGFDKLEFYLPFMRFHKGWDAVTEDYFGTEPEEMKGAVHYNNYLRSCKDVSALFNPTDDVAEPTDLRKEVFEDLLAYCKESGAKVLFTTVPQANISDSDRRELNRMIEIAAEEGFDTLHLINSMDEIGIDPKVDFYNESHLNVHGAYKFTEYVEKFLQEKYGFADKRGTDGYESWDAASEKYLETIASDTLDLERDRMPRDLSLNKPKFDKLALKDGVVNIAWTAVDGADSYVIYRKRAPDSLTYTPWEPIAECDAETFSFTDTDIEGGYRYNYIIVGKRTEGDVTYYGKYDYTGGTVLVP